MGWMMLSKEKRKSKCTKLTMFMMRVEEIFVVKAGAGGAETGEERV